MKPPQMSLDAWERLSAFQDGDVSQEEADALTEALANDPALAEALCALRAQTAALGVPLAAPAGFADRVQAAVEHEPIPANGRWWARVDVALVAVAAAAVLWVAIPWSPSGDEAPAQHGTGPVRAQPLPPPAALPPAAPANAVAPPRPAPPSKPAPTPDALSGEGTAPEPVVVPVPEGPGGTPDPEPAWVTQAGYSLQASDPAVFGRLKSAAARLGARLEDANGNPATLGTSGAVFLRIPASRLSELNRELTGIGAVKSHSDPESLVGDTLEVQINVLLRSDP